MRACAWTDIVDGDTHTRRHASCDFAYLLELLEEELEDDDDDELDDDELLLELRRYTCI